MPKFAEKLRQADLQHRGRPAEEHSQRGQEGAVLAGGGLGLERRFPERYARRGPDVITLEQVTLLLGQFSDIVAEEVPDRCRKRVLKRLEELAKSLGSTAAGEVCA